MLTAYFILGHYNSVETQFKPTLAKKFGIVATLILIACMTYMLYHEFDKWGVYRSIGL